MSVKRHKSGDTEGRNTARYRPVSPKRLRRKSKVCVCGRMCYVVGLSHILETGMVCEHEALPDALRGGEVWLDGERIKKEAAH